MLSVPAASHTTRAGDLTQLTSLPCCRLAAMPTAIGLSSVGPYFTAAIWAAQHRHAIFTGNDLLVVSSVRESI
jgi:hypothetical protein